MTLVPVLVPSPAALTLREQKGPILEMPEAVTKPSKEHSPRPKLAKGRAVTRGWSPPAPGLAEQFDSQLPILGVTVVCVGAWARTLLCTCVSLSLSVCVCVCVCVDHRVWKGFGTGTISEAQYVLAE